MSREPVVITGVGIVSAIGIGADEFFAGLLEKRSGIRSLADRQDGDLAPTAGTTPDGHWIGAPVLDFDPKKFVRPRKALKVMCREIQLGFASAQLAIEHGGLSDALPAEPAGAISPRRIGTVYGAEIYFNPPAELLDTMKACRDDSGTMQPGQFGSAARKEIMPLWMLKYLPNMPACQVGIAINAQGPNNSIVLGDVSGPAALAEAVSYLQRGSADLIMVGATGTRISGTRLSYRLDLPVPTPDTTDYEDLSRPQDPAATGVVGGEGAASLIVETAASAQQRGAKVLARVLGTASAFVPTDGIRTGQRSANRDSGNERGATSAITTAVQTALARARKTAPQIGMVFSHAMGDCQVDAAEQQALEACGIDAPNVAVSASLGHTGAASGMISMATAAIAVAEGQIPPTRHQMRPDSTRLLADVRKPDSPIALCLCHTTNGNATAVILGR